MVTLILLIRFVMNMIQIRRQIAKHGVQKSGNYSLVFIADNEVSFSFFNYIFPAQSDYANGAMDRDIFLHETVHAKEKHSIDILFIELCKIFLWFNPFVFLYKRAFQLNHEFIADDVVISNNKDVFNYQSLLLSKITQVPVSQLVSSSNYSITKKRFIMMTKKTNQVKSFFLKLGIIPIVVVIIFGFSKKVVAKKIIQKNIAAKVVVQDTNSQGISQAEFDDYQTAMKNALITRNGKTNISIAKLGGSRNANKYAGMYRRMSPEQKAQVAALKVPPPPPPYPYIKGAPINPPQPPKYIAGNRNISKEQYESFTYTLRSTWSRKDLSNGKYERGYSLTKESLEKLYPLYQKMSEEQKVGFVKIPAPDELSSNNSKIFITPSDKIFN